MPNSPAATAGHNEEAAAKSGLIAVAEVRSRAYGRVDLSVDYSARSRSVMDGTVSSWLYLRPTASNYFSGGVLVLSRRALPAVLAVALLGGVLVALEIEHRSNASSGSGEIVLRNMEAVLESHGLAAALDSLANRASSDTALQREGHQMAHVLGRRAVAERGGDAGVIRECRPMFASGCYHGVIEASLHNAGRIDMSELERLCLSVDNAQRPGPAFECIHGLGHGVLGVRGYDVETTLKDCDALSTSRLVASCHAGVFMEAINVGVGRPAMHDAHQHRGGHQAPLARGIDVDAADPYSPCQAYGDPYASSCWLFQGFLILRANGFDAARALSVCDRAPDRRAARCYESVGHQLTGLLQKGNRWILDQCARGQAALARHCAAGATLALNGTDWTGSRAADLCAAAPRDWKETCYRTASNALVDLAPAAQRAGFCESVERAYVEICREAGMLLTPTAAPVKKAHASEQTTTRRGSPVGS